MASNLPRRDFLKIMGAGVGAASVGVPAFNGLMGSEKKKESGRTPAGMDEEKGTATYCEICLENYWKRY